MPLKKILIFLCLSFYCSLSHSTWYLGYQFSVGTKGGFTLGKQLNEQQALEVHFKKKPGSFLTGLYYKQYFDVQSGYYTMLGYSAFVDTDRFNLGSGYQVHSINVGAGYRFTELESNYLVPLELGFGPAFHNIKKTTGLNGFAGFASYYRLQ